jgi:hypothetical protein
VAIFIVLEPGATDIPIDFFRHNMYVVDKKNVIVCEDRTATSYNIARREFKQNAHSKWRMFVATLTSSINVPAAGSESQSTLAKNVHEGTGAQLRLQKKGKNGNVIADLVERGKHAYKQGTIIKGSIIGSSLIDSLEGQPISKLIELIEEEKVSVNLYLFSSRHRGIRGIIHRARRAVLNTHNQNAIIRYQ